MRRRDLPDGLRGGASLVAESLNYGTLNVITRIIAPAILALLAAFSVACYGESTPQIVQVVVTATPEPKSEPAQSTPTARTMLTGETATTGPSPTRRASASSTATPEPTPTPTVRSTPTRPRTSDNDICYRSPEVQRQILDYLRVSLCQSVTEAELFRIDGEMEIGAKAVAPGDFNGLVNLLHLRIGVPAPIPPGTFHGLDNLETLNLNLYNLGPGTLDGLSRLKQLSIVVRPERELSEDEPENPRLTSDLLEGLPSLEALSIAQYESRTLSPKLLQSLPNLEFFHISFLPPEMNTDVGFSIPAGLFSNNPLLKYVKIQHEWGSSERFTVPRNAFAHLEHLQELRLPCCSASEDGSDHKVVINSKSPLFQAALNGGQHPDGIETGSSYVKILPP